MPTAVIDRVNVLGCAERSLLVFTDRQGRVIGDYAPTSVTNDCVEDEAAATADFYDLPYLLDEPTGVDMGVPEANTTPQMFNDAVFESDLDGGLNAEPPTLETQADAPPAGMVERNASVRKPPERYIPSMKGNKYEIALAQITTSLGT